MCKGLIKIFEIEQSNPITEQIEEIPWPLETNDEDKYFACDTCYFPIVKESEILASFLNLTSEPFTYGILVHVENLITTQVDNRNLFNEQWKRPVFCEACGLLLTFQESEIDSELREITTENTAILNVKYLNNLQANELKNLHEEI